MTTTDPRPSRTWIADDGAGGEPVEYEAASGREAAERYVADGDWTGLDERTSTQWIDVWVWQPGREEERESHTIALEPEEPECTEDDDGALMTHDWRDVGTWGHGGGVIVEDRCRHCGRKRVTDTWAQRPDTGEQGLRSVSYETSDDDY